MPPKPAVMRGPSASMPTHRHPDRLYRLLKLLGRPFRYRVIGLHRLPAQGPAIIIANHLGSIGPVEAILSLPQRLYPWVIGEMTDPRRAPRYLYDDFVHPVWGLSGPAGMLVSHIVARIAVGIINGIGSVPVDQNRDRTISAFRRSLQLLAEGQILLIFPEDNLQPAHPELGIHHFRCGFVGLCRMYEREFGGRLPVYPIAVHAGRRQILAGTAVFYEDGRGPREGIQQTCQRLYHSLCDLYARLNDGDGAGERIER